ncbi:hypothetical protein CN692_21960 [Bacillus sp. AFS002410]|uniref:uracil-DNA glycosylase family protein n=1 Tax=Bacillus sp. AFS002410 TaxID=2033481 RepID=UPI000BEF44E6|nr:uracil-DNA glycosylase family protein [Bacillus sp. AFS002410]PEJ52379.1 hypothetical protein CN692_21960 [Bacillus sp. AFS002410]
MGTSDVTKQYNQLINLRKDCKICVGLKNPFEVEKQFDVNEIGAWSKWKGDLDAKIVVVGQDWGDENSYISSKGVCDPNNATNQRLVALLESIGVSVENDKLFFTNAILCLKQGGLSGDVKIKWFNNCASHFLRPLLDTIKPEITITLGRKAYEAVVKVYNEKIMPFKEIVNQKDPHIIHSNDFYFKLFPVYHCGQLGLVNRNSELQFKDWDRIKEHVPILEDKRIVEIKHQDNEFENWCKVNTNGFVFNYAKGTTGNVLHRVGCYHLNVQARKGRYTFHPKYCSNDLIKLSERADELSKTDGWRACKNCFKE